MTAKHCAAIVLVMLAPVLVCAQDESARPAGPKAASRPSPWGTPVRTEGKTNMKVFVYKQADPQPLRMWVCYPEGWKASDTRAGMVFFCGGAWSHADHNEFVPWASYLTSRGMVTGVAEYRPKGAITCDEDATSAIRWFRAHCTELGVDPNRIGASGGSAGGQMAAYAAMCEPRNSPNEDVSVSAKPNVLVLFDAVLDMNNERAAGRLSGQDKASVSPIDHMAKDTVPTLLFYGTECPFVGQAREFLAKSKTMGNLVQLYTAPGGGHTYYFRQPWRELTFGHMDEFLVSLGYLNGSATIKVDTDLKHTNENVSPPATQPQAQSAPIGSAPARGDLGRPPAATGTVPAAGAVTARMVPPRAPDKVLTYKKAPGPDGQEQELKLHVYLPEGWKASDSRPAIILWFGGAFVMGDPKQFFPQAEYFASRGMVGISGEYRIKMGVPVSTEDARSAIRWMKTHAAELGIDPNKIAAGGGSAGGYLGAAVGTNAGPDAKGEDATVSVRPAALVLFNPALRAGGASAGAASSPAPAPATGGAGKAGRTGMDLSPPLEALSKDCPPSILFYGTTDNFIGPGRAFSEKALSLGVRSELWAAQAQGHGFFNGAPWAQATLEKADLFLASLGMLKGTPTVKVDPKAVLVRQVPADAATQPTSRPGSPELPRPAPDAGKPTPAGDPAGRADTAKLMDVYEARVYKDSQGRSLNYRLLKALNYDPKTRYPLVLFMHGKGASQGQDNKAQITAPGVMPAVTLFADPQVRQRFPAFVIVPQAPRELWVADGVIRSLTQTEKPTLTLQLVVEAMDALQKEFSIDTDRIYVTGTSYGGFGTWDLITRYPDKYAAAMPMAGGGDESKASLIAKLPIWNFHGAKDPVVPVDRSRRMIAAIEKTGGKPKYTEYPTAAHADAWGKAFAEKDLLEWLFAQKRSSAK